MILLAMNIWGVWAKHLDRSKQARVWMKKGQNPVYVDTCRYDSRW